MLALLVPRFLLQTPMCKNIKFSLLGKVLWLIRECQSQFTLLGFLSSIMLHHWHSHTSNVRGRKWGESTQEEVDLGREEEGPLPRREAARRRHICRSINFQLCGAWVSAQAAGAPSPVILELRWGNKATWAPDLCSLLLHRTPPPPKHLSCITNCTMLIISKPSHFLQSISLLDSIVSPCCLNMLIKTRKEVPPSSCGAELHAKKSDLKKVTLLKKEYVALWYHFDEGKQDTRAY